MPTISRGPRVPAVLLAILAVAFIGCDGEGPDQTQAQTQTPAAASPTATDVTGTPDRTLAPGEETGAMEWLRCPFESPGIPIECGALNVPADRDDPDAGTVRLLFGIVRANGEGGPTEAPIVYLSGGPGQSALELVPVAFGRVYGPLAEARDLIILDQRGTGYSEPSLSCDEYTAWAMESLGSDLPPEEQSEQAAQALEECRQRLLDEGVDLGDFDSEASAADLQDLREALGYEEWNLYGLSYGTRLALTAMRADPEAIRSVVLDAAYPVEATLYTETPDNLARAVEAFFAACTSDPDCSAAFPDLEDTFWDLVEELNENPASITVIEPGTGQQVTSSLTGNGLVGFLFQSLYLTDLIQFLPEIVAAAEEGEFGTIGLLEGSYVSELQYVSIGQQLAVQCNEEVAFIEEGEIAEAAEEHPLLEGFFTSAPTLGPQLFELCAGWAGSEEARPIANEPVVSDIPTLIVTGQLDPITPPRWGEAIERNLTNATFYEFPYTGHGVIPARDCGAAMVREFLDDPGADVDASCIEEIPPPPFTAEDVEVEMVPFTSPAGFESLRPGSWDEILPGVFQESPLIVLTQQAIPGATEEQFLQQVAAQVGLSEVPEPDQVLQGEFVRWNLYRFRNLGQAIDLATTAHEGTLLAVQLVTPPLRRAVYYEQAFLPAVESFDPANVSAPPSDTPVPTDGTTPAPTP